MTSKMWVLFGVAGLAITGVIVSQIDFKSAEEQAIESHEIVKVTWQDLGKLDYKSGRAPKELKVLEQKIVRIAGYIVPLDDNIKTLKEFLLVPNAQACIHVPPPPPNYMVHVKLKNEVPLDEVFNPSWVQGRLKILTTKSQYGNSGYQIDATLIERYRY